MIALWKCIMCKYTFACIIRLRECSRFTYPLKDDGFSWCKMKPTAKYQGERTSEPWEITGSYVTLLTLEFTWEVHQPQITPPIKDKLFSPLGRINNPPPIFIMTENGYEDNTAFLGEWGPFQQMVFFLLCLSIIPNGFTGMSIVFIGDTPSHHCLIPANANITGEWRNHSIPLEEESGTVVLSKCARYKLDVIKSFSERGYVPGIDVNVSEIQHETCLDGWEYDRGTYISTIVSEVWWDATVKTGGVYVLFRLSVWIRCFF